MNFKKTLQHYYNKRIDAIIIVLKLSDDAFTIKSFHHLRVEIKKLHAFFDLLDASVEDFPAKKYFRPFKKLFKALGLIRELQLEQDWLTKKSKHFPVDTYTRYLQKQEAEQTKQFLEAKDKFRKEIKNIGSKAFIYIDGIKKKKALAYLKNKGKKIEGLLATPGIDATAMHRLRIELKGYVYLLKALEEEEDHASHEKMDAFQDLLGKWHDSRSMADHLSEPHPDIRLSKTTTENLAKLSRSLDTNAKKQQREIALQVQALVAESTPTR